MFWVARRRWGWIVGEQRIDGPAPWRAQSRDSPKDPLAGSDRSSDNHAQCILHDLK